MKRIAPSRIRHHLNTVFPARNRSWLAPASLLVGWLLCHPALIAAELPSVATGVTEPIVDVTLSAPVAGIVSGRFFQEGDSVKKGDVILELDKRLEELDVQRRKLVLDMRKKDMDATQTLFEQTTSVPREELDKKIADYKVAVVEHEMALEQLRRRLITAPEDGVITEILLDPGEATDAYQPLVRLVDTKLCRLKCDVEAKAAAPLRINQLVQVELVLDGKVAKVDGKVTFLSPVADKASGLIKVKVVFDNRDGQFKPGLQGKMFFNP